MILLDVNVVVAAHRADHPHHPLVRPWFDRLTAGTEHFTVPHVVWSSFVRITTSRRIFTIPTPLDEAFSFLRAVRAQPNHLPTTPGPGHLDLFEELCRSCDASGDLSADAYLAAIALELGCPIATLDRDFTRFEPVQVVRPG